jgi:predicted AAA+ superfamily ATPase
MAPLRTRYLSKPLLDALRWSPSISVIGMRQTGKTTLMKQLSRTYLSLDNDQLLGEFERSNWAALKKAQAPAAIDECQKLPKLIDRIKLLIDERKQMGRFLMSGSVRFLSRKQIRESLTGRTLILEMLPFLISEAHDRPLRGDFLDVFKSSDEAWFRRLAKQSRLNDHQLFEHLERGGLPGIGFRRDAQMRGQLFQVHLDTLLGRDLFFLNQTRLTSEKLRNLYRELCLIQGLPINESEIARKTGMTPPTVKKMIDTFSGLFLLRRHGKTLYCEDGGLAEHAIVRLAPQSSATPQGFCLS